MLQLVFTKAWLIPLLLTIILLTGTLLPYYIAVQLDHIQPFFSFVSHGVGYPPQAAIFSGLTAVSSILGISTCVFRYVLIEHRNRFMTQRTVTKLNKNSLIIGCLGFVNLIFIAHCPMGFPASNKQDYIWNVGSVHFLGAVGSCVCSEVYVFMQLYLWILQSKITKDSYFAQRSFTAVALLLFFSTIVASCLICVEFLFLTADDTGVFQVPNYQNSYILHTAALLEWIFIVISLAFLATFSFDFKYISVILHLEPKCSTSTYRSHIFTPRKEGKKHQY